MIKVSECIFNKTRIAPTPSGFLHLGNVLSFVITAALAQKNKAKILLRIDDLDRLRVNEHYIQDIFDTLNFLEIPWDEGPGDVRDFEDNYSQRHRMPFYREAMEHLRGGELVFACTCSRKQTNSGTVDACECQVQQIPLDTQNASWRLISGNNKLPVKTYQGQLIDAKLPAEMHNFIVRKKDGYPSYQLTSLIDDLYYGIDLIVRGDDLWPSTLAQQQLALALGKSDFGDITFYHHPLIMETSGKKLSKSAGANSVKYLREKGKSPADIYTQIAAMLGTERHINNWQQLYELIKLLDN